MGFTSLGVDHVLGSGHHISIENERRLRGPIESRNAWR
jgi:hypothetical protein